jgi:hypothetical protein
MVSIDEGNDALEHTFGDEIHPIQFKSIKVNNQESIFNMQNPFELRQKSEAVE